MQSLINIYMVFFFFTLFLDRHYSNGLTRGKKCTSNDICMPKLAYPIRWTRHETNPNIPTFEKENFTQGALRLNPNKLVREKARKNKYCLPTEKEMQRRKELFAEFDRMHNLAQETCDWLVSHGFVVSNNDRRNLSALMKTCFDPLAFSSLGKKPKEIFLVQQESDGAVTKTVKLAEKERFGHLMKIGKVGNALKTYIKKQKETNSKIVESPRLGENKQEESHKTIKIK